MLRGWRSTNPCVRVPKLKIGQGWAALALGSNPAFSGARQDHLWEAAALALYTGQSRDMVEHYARQVNQKRLAAAAILKWETADAARTASKKGKGPEGGGFVRPDPEFVQPDRLEKARPSEMLVGAARFELATPSPPDWCANQAALRSEPDGNVSPMAFRHLPGPGPRPLSRWM